MSYVMHSLAPGEIVRYRARIHWIIWLRAGASLILLGIIFVGIVIFVRDLILMTTTEVAITDRRLIKKTGWLSRRTSELELSSVEAVNLNQSVWARVLGCGKILVHGTGDDVWASPLISGPVHFRRELEAALSHSPVDEKPAADRHRPSPAAAERPNAGS
jgi:uncharacterized membrane protein YdbT with pleckstrin-like domain